VKFVLVHHGEVDGGPESNDPPLSAAGLRQARAVADELRALAARGERHVAVLSGPLQAPLQAAALIADALDIETPEARSELALDDMDQAAEALQELAWSLIETLKASQEPDASLVLVAHELTIRLLVCRALSMPLDEMRRFALQPGSLSVIEYRTQPRERTLIASLNETCHLEDILA
jgi:broad specificity phosphatase PhoE